MCIETVLSTVNILFCGLRVVLFKLMFKLIAVCILQQIVGVTLADVFVVATLF